MMTKTMTHADIQVNNIQLEVATFWFEGMVACNDMLMLSTDQLIPITGKLKHLVCFWALTIPSMMPPTRVSH